MMGASFGSVLGLAWLPDLTTLGSAVKPATIAFGRGDNAPSHNSC